MNGGAAERRFSCGPSFPHNSYTQKGENPVSVFDGTEDEPTFGEVLVYMAERISWATEHQKNAAVRAIQKEFDMVPPEPDSVTNPHDARDITIRNQDNELAELNKRLELAERRRQVAEAEKAAAESELSNQRSAQTDTAFGRPAAWDNPDAPTGITGDSDQGDAPKQPNAGKKHK